jgi:general secretion pathway protein G
MQMNSIRRTSPRKGFTLVEILIVVIILGILAAIVIPQFTNASTDARKSNMASQDQTIKSQVSLYMLQHNDTPPTLETNWNQLTEVTDVAGNTTGVTGYNSLASFGPYMQTAPVNPLTNSSIVVDQSLAPVATAGWYYNSATGAFTGANSVGAMSDTGN